MIYYIGEERLFEGNIYKQAHIADLVIWLNYQKIIQVDTETEGWFDFVNKIICLQIGNKQDQWVIDINYVGKHIQLLESYFKDKSVTKLFHNAKFDIKFLKYWFGWEIEGVYDTLLAECCLTNGLLDRELSLEACCLKYCNKQLKKEVRGKINRVGLTDEVILYAAEDVKYLEDIRDKQLLEVDRYEIGNALELENKAVLALADIELNGWSFDKDKWKANCLKSSTDVLKYEKELDVLVKQEPKLAKYIAKYVQVNMFDYEERDVTIKWSSPVQVQKLFKQLGLDIESSSEKEIAKYQNQYPIVKKFIDYKKEQKLLTTYGENFFDYIDVRGKITTEFWQIVDTFRVSSGSKQKPNLQNLPAKNEYLNCFTAAKGWKIVGIDYAAQEARVAASGSKEPVWMNTFLEGKDLHAEVCKMMFNITDDLVRTKPDFLRGKTYRDVAKTINFGVLNKNLS